MQYFGEPWDAPLVETSTQAPTPVGKPCYWCTLAIKDGDTGILFPGFDPDAGPDTVVDFTLHKECFFAATAGGSVHHLRGKNMRPEDIRSSAVALWDLTMSVESGHTAD